MKTTRFPITPEDIRFMEMAAKIAEDNIDKGGGPFGAVTAGSNAICQACSKEQTFSLRGCKVYSSCEPCPMCLSALYWAGVDRIYYGNTQEDADKIDFSDKFIYRELEKSHLERSVPCIHIENDRTPADKGV